MRSLFAVLLLLVLSSCFMSRAQQDRPLSESAYASLVVGTSTSEDAASVLGAPTQVVELGTGSAWLYRHGLTKRAGLFLLLVGFLNEDAQSDRIWLFFDERGVLRSAAASFEAASAEWEMPWSAD